MRGVKYPEIEFSFRNDMFEYEDKRYILETNAFVDGTIYEAYYSAHFYRFEDKDKEIVGTLRWNILDSYLETENAGHVLEEECACDWDKPSMIIFYKEVKNDQK